MHWPELKASKNLANLALYWWNISLVKTLLAETFPLLHACSWYNFYCSNGALLIVKSLSFFNFIRKWKFLLEFIYVTLSHHMYSPLITSYYFLNGWNLLSRVTTKACKLPLLQVTTLINKVKKVLGIIRVKRLRKKVTVIN